MDHGGSQLSLEVRQKTMVASTVTGCQMVDYKDPHCSQRSGSGPWRLPTVTSCSMVDHGSSPLLLEIRQWAMVAPHCYQRLDDGPWCLPAFTRGPVGHPCPPHGHQKLDSGSWWLFTVTRGHLLDNAGSSLSLEVRQSTMEALHCHFRQDNGPWWQPTVPRGHVVDYWLPTVKRDHIMDHRGSPLSLEIR